MKILQPDWAGKWAVYSPSKVAIKEYETDRTLTYSDLNQKAIETAYWLKTAYDIKKGDRVAVLAEYCLEYIVLFSAAQKLGFILVPLNYRLASTEIGYLLKDADPTLFWVEPKFQHLVPESWQNKHLLPIEHLFQLIKTEKNITFKNTNLNENDPIFILYTSGTTGFPKGALYTHKMLLWNSLNTAMSLIVNQESRTLCFMPPFHTGGWNVLLAPFLHHGGYTCLLKKFDAAAILKLLQTEQCTIFMGVPTMLKMMSNLPNFEDATFPNMYYAIVGGEAMPIPLIEQWHAKGVMIRQGYGLTEVGPNLTSLHQNDAIRKKGSIGRQNYYVDIRIVDEHGKKSNNGELLLKGPMVTPGYWRNPEATKKAIINAWFRTGDRMRIDDEGYLYVIDRIKNMFISGGENVYPAEIERVLLAHEGISEVAVVGVSDEKWGEVGKAFIVKKANYALEISELTAYLKDKLAKFKIPKYIVFIDALPKNDTGKINRIALKNYSHT